MALHLGTVVELGGDGHIAITLDQSDQITLTATEQQALTTASLGIGDRVRLTIGDSRVTKLTKLGNASALPAPQASPQPRVLTARVIWADPKNKTVELQTDDGKVTFKPSELSAQVWERLRPGVTLTLAQWPDGNTELQIPVAVEAEPPIGALATLGPTEWHTGSVQVVEKYYGTVKTDEGTPYTFVTAPFADMSLRAGDRVQFQADEEQRQITGMNLLERAIPGRGWDQPCSVPLDELLSLSERKPIHQLIRHFCDEKRLQWYWVVPKTPPVSTPASDYLQPAIIQAIKRTVPTFSTLYRHQVRSLQSLKQGRHVMVLTPTASGKTYCYTPAVFEAIAGDPSARALYVFPLNALLTDQYTKLENIRSGLRVQGIDVRIAKLVGGMTSEERGEIIQNPPNVLAVNPEMLSFMLQRQNEGRLSDFFANLRYIVLDEAHAYRSMLGMHMAGLVRRLRLACQRNGNPDSQFILSSATIGDPKSLAEGLTALKADKFEFISEQDNGAAQPLRHWMMLDNEKGDEVRDGRNGENSTFISYLNQAAQALVDVLTIPRNEPLNAILFVRTYREMRYVLKVVKSLLLDRNKGDLVGRVTSYASGLLDSARKEEIYTQLKHGKSLRAVVATNALEAGIDLEALDVCILAGFPDHAMRMRQMAGRAGRQKEGAVIYVPDPSRGIDRYYSDKPTRLITQPPEAFVIDPGNPYIAGKHVVTAAATLPGGIKPEELAYFGDGTDRIIREALKAGVLVRDAASYTARMPRQGSKWAVERIRGNEQIPYALCKAAESERLCTQKSCLAQALSANDTDQRCEHLVQLLDKQYVYRETHPGAIFEDIDGNFYRCDALDEDNKIVYVMPLPADPLIRTFPLEQISVEILGESGRRDLANGAQLAWGDARVTRAYDGYGQYHLIPSRYCRRCKKSYAESVRECPSCNGPTRFYIEHTDPDYLDYPDPYSGRVFSIELDTIACWLTLPAKVEDMLQSVAPCKIASPQNKVAELLRTKPPFKDASDVSRVTGMSVPAGQATLDYFQHWSPHARVRPPAKDQVWVHPIVYGQCLCHHLRKHLPDTEALSAFSLATGYPVITDIHHICRKCYGGVLLLATHTLEHIVAQNYPVIALGDSQDIGSTTTVLHPQTHKTTTFWFDAYEGGIGAAEKIYARFESLVEKVYASLECKCGKDEGCPLCTELPRCDRHNYALSKVAAAGLANVLLGRQEYIPTQPTFWHQRTAEERTKQAEASEHAKQTVPLSSDTVTAIEPDPFQLLRVQHYVHDAVLERALEVRGEEAAKESPPLLISDIQSAYEHVKQTQRPDRWIFDPKWSPYETLHIQTTASTRLARSAYLTIIKAIHPDRNGIQPWSTIATQNVNNAWDTIKNERQKNEA